MITMLAMIVDGKYKLNFEGLYFLTFILDLVCLVVIESIFT